MWGNKMSSLEELKARNEAPEWLTEAAWKTLKNGYLLENETPRDMWLRVSRAAASRLNKPELAERFFDAFWKGWLGGATPVLANMGTERGLPISCFGATMPDSVDGIFKTVHELAMLSKHGGTRKEIVDKIQREEKKTGQLLSPDRIDNSKGYESSNVRAVPEELNRGRHKVDEKKLKEWREKIKKYDLTPEQMYTMMKRLAIEANDNGETERLVKSVGLEFLNFLFSSTEVLDNEIATDRQWDENKNKSGDR